MEAATGIEAETVFEQVFRVGLEAPGHAIIDCGPDFGSRRLRTTMVRLKAELDRIARQRLGKALVYLSAGRFDQRATTKFHLDGAPDESALMLGYEPSGVNSRLFLADYSRMAHDLGIEPKTVLERHNPMFAQGERALEPYAREVREFDPSRFMILLINNSRQSYRPRTANLLGVMHKAEILNPESPAPRIVNSTMIGIVPLDSSPNPADAIAPEVLERFLHSDDVARRHEPSIINHE